MRDANLVKTLLGSIIIMTSFLLIPDSILPGYNVVGYGSVASLILILGGILMRNISSMNITSDMKVKEILVKSGVLSMLLIPVIVLLFTNIKYKDALNKNSENLPNYKALKILTTLILLAQTYMLLRYLFGEEKSMNDMLGLVLLSVLNGGMSLLLWSRLAFFMTDGFRVVKK